MTELEFAEEILRFRPSMPVISVWDSVIKYRGKRHKSRYKNVFGNLLASVCFGSYKQKS